MAINKARLMSICGDGRNASLQSSVRGEPSKAGLARAYSRASQPRPASPRKTKDVLRLGEACVSWLVMRRSKHGPKGNLFGSVVTRQGRTGTCRS